MSPEPARLRDLSEPRLPPQNLEAEQSVLGAVLLDNAALAKAMEILGEADFYRTAHQKIFRAMLELSEQGEVIDTITLGEHLRTAGELEAVGGTAYLAELVQIVPSAANVRYHSRIVRDKALLRGLIGASTEVIAKGYEDASPVQDLLEFAQQSIFGLAQGKYDRSFAEMRSLILDSIELVDQLYKKKEQITGIPTGFIEIDGITAGLQPSDLVIVAGRPSMGKTSLALGMVQTAAVEYRKAVGVFSLEMSGVQLVLRMLSSEALVDSHLLRTGKLSPGDWTRLTAAADKLSQAKIFIDDSGALTVQQMRGKARQLKMQHGLDLLVVDYLQLMQGRADAESRQQEISDISRSLKALAKELNIPIVALSQLSRAVETRADKRPVLADLRESGAIEQDADVVMFIYRDEHYNPESTQKPGIADILIRKHRNGPTGDIELTFLDKFAKFANKSDRDV
jgi:replicative DNA helicase